MNKMFKSVRPPKKQSGFTLLELLIASVMTFFVVSATGWGLLVMLREQTATSASSDVAQNTNRAMDFITEEIKTASSILTSFSTATGCNGSDYTPILGITVSGQSAPIIYCINSNANTSSTNTSWLGKYVVYRWGPSFQSDGSYGSWSSSPRALIDLVAESPENDTCTNSGWTQIPASSPKGFFVCVNPDQNMAEVHLETTALDTKNDSAASWASNKNSRLGNRATYQASSTVFTRAPSDVVVTVAPTTLSGTGTLTFTFNRLDSTSAGTVNFTETPPVGATYTMSSTSPISFTAGQSIATVTVSVTSAPASDTAITLSTGNQSATAALTPP